MKKPVLRILTLIMISILPASSLFAQTRITFKRGKSAATVSGRLAAGASRIYVVNAREGQNLKLAATGDVSYEILGNDYVSAMSGSPDYSEYNLVKSGDYRIKIISNRKATNFTLTITVQ
jgi:hypothetical protein